MTRCDDSVFAADASSGALVAWISRWWSPPVPIWFRWSWPTTIPRPGDGVTIVGYPTGVRTVTDARIEGSIRPAGTARSCGSVPSPEPGQSGSPLVDRDGKLVGIAFAEDTVGGQGLAIPVSRVRASLEQGARGRRSGRTGHGG